MLVESKNVAQPYPGAGGRSETTARAYGWAALMVRVAWWVLARRLRKALTSGRWPARCAGGRSDRSAAAAPRRSPACPGEQNVFYMAPVNGGVWKTTDFGRTWTPIFDDQPTGSIGAIAVAPSDPNVIYVGSGEGLAAARPLGRRRHLQVDRRRQDLDASRPSRRPADSGHHRRSAQREPAVRRRARPSVRSERGARRLSLDRRRRDVPEGPLQGREHRRVRSRIRSDESRHRLRRACGSSGRVRGRTARGPAPAAASSSRPTAARPGVS